MAKQIYNEGRVVGYSAYESYIRQALSYNAENPDEPISIVPEKDWLAASLAYGSSILVRLHIHNNVSSISIDLPDDDGCGLWANNTIIGTFFHVNSNYSAEFPSELLDESGCGGYVLGSEDYTDLINYTHHISQDRLQEDVFNENSLLGYLAIVDGFVSNRSTFEGQKFMSNITIFFNDLDGKLKDSGDIFILLSGFTHESVVKPVAKEDSDDSANSDFLGPSVKQSTARISFVAPPTAFNKYIQNNYKTKAINIRAISAGSNVNDLTI